MVVCCSTVPLGPTALTWIPATGLWVAASVTVPAMPPRGASAKFTPLLTCPAVTLSGVAPLRVEAPPSYWAAYP